MKISINQAQRDIIAAYIIDRTEGGSKDPHAIAFAIRLGEAEIAFAHGELDDLLIERFGWPETTRLL